MENITMRPMTQTEIMERFTLAEQAKKHADTVMGIPPDGLGAERKAYNEKWDREYWKRLNELTGG